MNAAAPCALGSVRPFRLAVRSPSRTRASCSLRIAVMAAKLPYGQSENNARNASLQTSATNPSVNSASVVQPELASLEQLEKLFSLEGSELFDAPNSMANSLEALQDVEALLQDLEGLGVELESALEVVQEDLTELTVRLHIT